MKKATIGSRSYVRQNPETHSYLKLEEGDRRDAVCNIVLLFQISPNFTMGLGCKIGSHVCF